MLKRLKKVRVKKEKQENQKNKYIRFDNININTIISYLVKGLAIKLDISNIDL